MFSGPHLPEFLLPFRKPKRIRTAFSPSQLLKLEQAFEKNQYVVGQERKELAKSLNLSETQVTALIIIIITTSLCTVDARPATIAPSSRLNAANTTIVQICMFISYEQDEQSFKKKIQHKTVVFLGHMNDNSNFTFPITSS